MSKKKVEIQLELDEKIFGEVVLNKLNLEKFNAAKIKDWKRMLKEVKSLISERYVTRVDEIADSVTISRTEYEKVLRNKETILKLVRKMLTDVSS